MAFLGIDTTSQAIEMGFPFFFFPMSETDFGGLWRSVTSKLGVLCGIFLQGWIGLEAEQEQLVFCWLSLVG